MAGWAPRSGAAVTLDSAQRKAYRLVEILATFAPARQVEQASAILSAATNSGDSLSFATWARVDITSTAALAEASALANELMTYFSGEYANYWRMRLAAIIKASTRCWITEPRPSAGI